MRFYVPTPTIERFFASDALIRAVMGPIGSGKTSGTLIEIARRALKQTASPVDGVSYSRWLVVRDTYRNLERTTIKSWKHWIPPNKDEWRGGANGEPGIHTIQRELPDGRRIDCEVLFVAIGDADFEDVTRGLEITGAYVNELDRVPLDVVHSLAQRAGRYPPALHGGPTWRGVWGDFNAPNWGDPVEQFFISERPAGVDFFSQPSGLAHDAENLENLPGGRGYYLRQLDTQPEHFVRRMIKNELGFSRDGKPVYPEFSDRTHVSEAPIQPLKGRTILIAADAGRQPAAVFMQKALDGQLRAIDEFVGEDMGARTFGERLEEKIAEDYPESHWVFEGVCDPAAEHLTETASDDEDAWFEIVSRASGVRFRGASSNKRADREEGLRAALLKNITAERPAFVVSPRCKLLRQALNHGFRFAKRKIGGDLYNEVPEKNGWSHVAEACEYGVMHLTGMAVIRGRRAEHEARRGEAETVWRPRGFA